MLPETINNEHSELQIPWQEAIDPVLIDLVNALLTENTFNIRDRGELTQPDSSVTEIALKKTEQLFRVWLEPEKRYLLFRVKPSIFVTYQISRPPVLLVSVDPKNNFSSKKIGPVELIEELAKALSTDETSPDLSRFLKALRLAVKQTALSLNDFCSTTFPPAEIFSSLLKMERLASYRDRPFHPTAQAKVGWSEADYCLYSTELTPGFGLRWVALRRDYLLSSSAVAKNAIADFLLDEQERIELEKAFEQAGISELDYLALPVHPWQQKHILPQIFAAEIAARICILLEVETGKYFPTSSLRTLTSQKDGVNVKLPLSLYSLGALRVLPTRYFINGEKGQDLLEQIVDREPKLQDSVYLCDETKWWSFHAPENDLFDTKPGHLACLIRQYPLDSLPEENILIPMSALAVNNYHDNRNPIFAQWLNIRGEDCRSSASILNLFGHIAYEFTKTALMFARYGAMPEIHGQNVLLVLEDGVIKGFLLRDHDTVRICPDWMEQAELERPGYLLKPNTPNTLVNETPAEFLAYFQTLAIEVNLYSIIDALSNAYDIEEVELWQVLHRSLKQSFNIVDFSAKQRSVIEQKLFKDRHWPYKQLIAPLLYRRRTRGASMPSALQKIDNPFHNFEAIKP